MKVIIVSGGISGLTTYHALQTYLPSKVSVKVYESYPSPNTTTSSIGGGIGIIPNGLRALNAISPASVLYLRAHGNQHEALLLGIPDGIVKWGKKIVEVKERVDAAQVVFEDGAVETCDLVIGADGVKSVCREALFGKEAYQAQYDGLTGIGGFMPFASLTPSLQRGLKADQAVMTFSCDGFFGYALALPGSTPIKEQQVMFWSTHTANMPLPRDLPSEDLCVILMQKHGSWKSPYASAFLSDH
ncbi:hypothetical protein F5146DRAFT_1139639 [Armillaria mellea]|nr:hypothetical protein F5146DRAFT_1139639 [Armillaria mellea]